MKYSFILLLNMLFVFASCNSGKEDSIEAWKKEIMNAERAFADKVKADGIPAGFLAFAADNAVLKRNGKLVIGKEAIKSRFDNQTSQSEEESLDWEPDYIDVSESGDMAYTYGKFTYSYTDSTGTTQQSNGFFHTVWKRQSDGSWKYVWD